MCGRDGDRMGVAVECNWGFGEWGEREVDRDQSSTENAGRYGKVLS